MKTLVVQYLPRGERSHTRAVLAAFEKEIRGEVDRIDLLETMPDFFTADRIMAYIRRDYLDGMEPGDEALMAGMDDMVRRMQEADVLVVATPMHNFGLPGLVKAWFDAVMLKGHTWTIGDHGYEGLLGGRKALVINASGGVYEGEGASMDHLQPAAQFNLRFMGYEDVRGVSAAGVLQPDLDKEKIVREAGARAASIAREWYGDA